MTERLLLREAVVEDAPFILELLNSRGFIENIADRGVRTEDQARDWIRDRVLASYAAHGFGMWIVETADPPAPIGIAGLLKRDGLDHPDVGYAFLEHAWGRGYAQETAAAVLTYARERLGIATIVAITSPDNHASMTVLKKVGLTFQGMILAPGFDAESTYFMTAEPA